MNVTGRVVKTYIHFHIYSPKIELLIQSFVSLDKTLCSLIKTKNKDNPFIFYYIDDDKVDTIVIVYGRLSLFSAWPHLTHWGRVTHICVGKLYIIGSDNGLSPGRRQAIIWTNAGILLIGTLGTNSSEYWLGIETFSIKKMHLKMSSAKWRLFGLGLNVLKLIYLS